ncbi:MAG TPA: hypothetical protein VFN02_05895 [Ktedonobacteraceae bacterium]|nr:hypothetical protein [Ktedonobacteraceae bacterium]
MNSTHTVPTHINIQEKIGVGQFTLTPRQMFYVIIAFALGYRVFRSALLLSAFGLPGLVLRLVLSVLPIVVLLFIGAKTIAGRTIEIWLLLWLLYFTHPGNVSWWSVLVDDRFAIDDEKEDEV